MSPTWTVAGFLPAMLIDGEVDVSEIVGGVGSLICTEGWPVSKMVNSSRASDDDPTLIEKAA